MSRSSDRPTPRVRRSAQRRSRKNQLRVEALEGRALLTLDFVSAFNIQGSGVVVKQAAIDPAGNTYVAGYYTGTATFGKDASGSPVQKKNSTVNTNVDGVATPAPEAFVVAYSPAGVV